MLVAEIAATEGCSVAGGCEEPGSGYVNQDIGELAGVGRIGIPIGDTAERLIRDSDVVINSPRRRRPPTMPSWPPPSAPRW